MNVLFLSQIVPYPPHGGVLQRGYNIIRELGRHASVHLLAFVHPDVLRTSEAVEDSRRALLEFCEAVEYFPLWPKASSFHRTAALAYGLFAEQPFSVIAHRSAAFQQRVTDIMQRGPIDLVHADTVALSQFVPLDGPVPTVLTHHNIESTLMERRARVEPRALARFYLRREATKLRAYESAMSPRFDVNVLVSPQDRTTLLDMAPGLRTAVVPNGVDIDYFSPDPSRETPSLIYAGGMNMFANRDAVMYFLQDIWPMIVAEEPDVRFYVVGQDPPRELRSLEEHDPRIIVTGYLDDVRPMVLRAAVYVVPLRVGGGTRLKVLDAMASGKALVSTSIGCEGLDVRTEEHLLIRDQPEAFARATVELLRSPERRRALAAAARACVERHYSWKVVAEHLLDAYRQAGCEKGRVA